MLISYVFYSSVSEKRISGLRFWIGSTVLFEMGAIINLVFANTIWLNVLSFFIINIVFALFFFRVKLLKSIFYSALLNIFSAALEFATIFIVSVLFNVNIDDYNSNTVILIIEGIISKVLYFIVCLILLNFIKTDKNNTKFPLTLYAYPTSAVILLLTFWYICSQGTIDNKSQIVLAIASILLFGSTVILFISYQHSIEKENQYVLLKSENNRLQNEKTYYDILEHQNQQLLLYAHDAKNHLNTIKDLNTNPAIDTYIKKMYDNLINYSSVSNSGNMTLDVILNRYKTESKLKGIDFSFDIHLGNLAFVDDFDLVAILDNLLDNAMESAEKSNAKIISFETDRRNNHEVVIIFNSCDQKPIFHKNRLLTTKKDKVIHGLGLKSVAKTLKKYDGDIAWEYLENERQFVTTVMMENSE